MRLDRADDPGDDLVAQCGQQARALLHRNLTPRGILAATRTAQSEERSYTRVFGRDAAICILAMAGSGDAPLERGAIASLDALADGQAPNGQIPKYVDPEGKDADFWYLGCIDATLWWLIAVDHVRRHGTLEDTTARWLPQTVLALQWLLAQEHQRFFLLQQNEASDWADIMPRSGFVLYTNALWFHVKRLYDLPEQAATLYHANHLFDPNDDDLPTYRRSRLLSHYARRGRRGRGLYLSFVNLSFVGDEGDTFGNLLAVLYGLADAGRASLIMDSLQAARAQDPFPGRTVVTPIATGDPLWRAYMARHRQNHPYQYHNGGIWPFVGGFWVLALLSTGRVQAARQALQETAFANASGNWRFTEWFNGKTLEPSGMPGQSWNAAVFELARRALGLLV